MKIRKGETMAEKKIKIGISACLLGEKCRYNGETHYRRFDIEQAGCFALFRGID